MPSLNALAPNYRRAFDRWPDALMLQHAYNSLEECYEGVGHGLVEHVKSFIESVCVTILGEFGKPLPSATPSTTELLIGALGPLGLQNTRGASKLDKVLSGFNTLADALTEMRNAEGPVAHGKDAFLDAICTDHARAFLHTGDAILAILLNALDGIEPDLLYTREPYERFSHLNERIDRVVSANARVEEDSDQPTLILSLTTGGPNEEIEIRVEPSRLLYGIDRSAYIEMLSSTGSVVKRDHVQEVDEDKVHRISEPEVDLGKDLVGVQVVANVEIYEGLFQELQDPLLAFLSAEGIHLQDGKKDEALVSSLLATFEKNIGLDWQDREMIQSRLKVACKRVLVSHGTDSDNVEDFAARIVSWFNITGRSFSESMRFPDVK